jgi:hypothetical protein
VRLLIRKCNLLKHRFTLDCYCSLTCSQTCTVAANRKLSSLRASNPGLEPEKNWFFSESHSSAHLRPQIGLKSTVLRPPLQKPERRGTHQPKFMVDFDPDCLRLRLRLMLRINRRFPRTKNACSAPRAAPDSLRETVSLLTT